jgi:hypothetical protein
MQLFFKHTLYAICSPSDHLQRLRDIYEPLTMKLEAKKTAKLMFQYNALTARELESVLHSNMPTKSAERLLDIILKIPEHHVYTCFLNALKQTNQEHVWSWLSNTGR